MIGTTGIGYNVDMLKQRFGGSTDIANSWDRCSPENISKMKDCGVTIPDTPADMIPIALHYRPGPAQRRPGRTAEGGRPAEVDPPVRSEFPLLAVRGFAGQRRYLPGGRLVR